MGRKQPAQEPGTVDKAEQLKCAVADEETHQGRAKELKAEKSKLEDDLRGLDFKLREEVDALLKSLPPDDSGRVVAELGKFKQSGRSQLVEKIENFRVAIMAASKQADEARMKQRQIQKEMDEEARDLVCIELHKELFIFIERLKAANGQRQRLFDQASSAGFVDFAKRFERLGLKCGTAAGAMFETYFKHAERKNELSVSVLADALVSMGACYGQTLFSQSGPAHAADNIPLNRNWYFNPPISVEKQ